MCGRYASFTDAQDLADEFAITEIADDARQLAPSWNIAPTDPVRIVVERAAKPEATADLGTRYAAPGPPIRSLQVARWGLVPAWSKDPKSGARMINARVETLVDKPVFAKPLAARRCLVPAGGYYEWQVMTADTADLLGASGLPAPTPRPRGRTPKQPFFIHGPNITAFAGLFEFWRNPAATPDDPHKWLVTTTVITTAAARHLAHIHDRMPVALPASAWDVWLDPQTDATTARALLDNPVTALEAVAVSPAVNTVANNGPDLVKPLG